MSVKRIVLTGAPGCGKSTLLLELGKRGFQVMPEIYRWLKVIEAIESNSSTFNPKTLSDDQFLFYLALHKFIDDQPSDKIDYCFYDRSLIDVVAYCRAYKQFGRLKLCWEVANTTSKHIFCCFLIPTPNIIHPDELRKENIKEACRLYDLIEDTYKKYGIKLIKLKKNNLIKLADEIILNLNHFKKNDKNK